MKPKDMLEEMDALEKTVAFDWRARWGRLRHLVEQACAVEEAAQHIVDEAYCDCEHKFYTIHRGGVYLCGFCKKPRR
jgi:hypothetical protein